jgi:hypothetical protein
MERLIFWGDCFGILVGGDAKRAIIDSDIAHGRYSAANTAVPAGFAGKLAASRLIGYVELNSEVGAF